MNTLTLAAASLPSVLLTASAVGIACAVLSVFVVLRRWAFIGEGIAHAGFGGAGTAWALSLLFPTALWLHHSAAIQALAVVFCLAVALAIAAVTRRGNVDVNTAIGIFLVASLAWGFVAFNIYRAVYNGLMPPEWNTYILGQMAVLSAPQVLIAILTCIAVLAAVALSGKELLAYSFDPDLAEVSGVRVGFVHYLLILLLSLTIIVGMPLVGSLLVVALLVLPGAAAAQLSRKFSTVMTLSVATGLLGALAGPLIHWRFPAVPEGPAIVLTLVLLFAIAFASRRLRRGETL